MDGQIVLGQQRCDQEASLERASKHTSLYHRLSHCFMNLLPRYVMLEAIHALDKRSGNETSTSKAMQFSGDGLQHVCCYVSQACPMMVQ